MIVNEFEYFRPARIREAVKLIARLGPDARILAGGTDLVGWLRDGLVSPTALIDIKDIAELKDIRIKAGRMIIGALVTISELVESEIIRSGFPLFVEMGGMMACTGIRNRATVVGNICSAVPCCDNGPVLQVHDALVHTAGPQGKRKIPIVEWFAGPRKTAILPGELVTSVSLPVVRKKHGGCFTKLKRYRGEDLAQASVAVLALGGNHYRISFGSVAPTPVRAPRIEALLDGKKLTGDLIAEALNLVQEETAPITDIRSSREYRAQMLKVMLNRALETAVARLHGNGPEYGVNVLE